MMRKKKKRTAVPVKNLFEELALPFNGRRMLIRSEDIQSTNDDSSFTKLSVTRASTLSLPTMSCGQDTRCMNSQVRLTHPSDDSYFSSRTTADDDNDVSDVAESSDTKHTFMLVPGEPHPCDTSCSGNDGSVDIKLEKEESVTNTSGLGQHLGISEGITETNRYINDKALMSFTPEEGRCKQTYHIRRQKQCEGDNGSGQAYVIRVNCGSCVNSHVDPKENEGEPPVCAKRRRGDITGMKPFVEETMTGDTSSANQTPVIENTSADLENVVLQELPQYFIDSICSSKMCEASNGEGDQQRVSSKTSCSTKKVYKRLIDHLDSKQALQPTTKTEIEQCINNTEREEASRKLEASSRTRDRKPNRIRPVKKDVTRNHSSKTGLLVGEPKDMMNGTSSDSLTNQRAVLHLTNDESKVTDVLESQDCKDSNNENKSANMNVNKKKPQAISRSKVTIFQSDEPENTERIPVRPGLPIASNVGQRSRMEIKRGNNGCALISSIHDREENSETSVESDFCECHNRSNVTNKTSYISFLNGQSNGDIVSRESGLWKSQTPVAIKRLMKSQDIGTSDSATQTDPVFSGSDIDEHPNGVALNKNTSCTPRSDKQRSSMITSNTSPHRASQHVRPYVSSISRSRNQAPHLPTSNNSRNVNVRSPEETHCINLHSCSALKQTLQSPPGENSPALSIALQNENHSNRMDADFDRQVCFDTRFTRGSCQTHVSPPPRIISNVGDESGMTTLNEINRVLEEARAKNFARQNASRTQADYSKSKDGQNMFGGSNFMGEYLQNLWKYQMFCDTRVTVGPEEFLVHKLVLAAYSSIFCPCSPQPEPTVCFSIPDTTPEAVRQIFSYMYTSTMTLNDDLLEPVVNAAKFMGAEEIINIVTDILIRPSPHNMNLYNSIIRRAGLQISLLDQQQIYREAFGELKNTEAFLLLPVDKVEAILMDPEVLVSDESETIEVIASWIEYNYMQRINMLGILLKHVNYECMSTVSLFRVTEKYKHIFETGAGNSFLCNAYKYHALKCISDGTQMTKEQPNFPVVNDSNEVQCEKDFERPCIKKTRNKKFMDKPCMDKTCIDKICLDKTPTIDMPWNEYPEAVSPSTSRTSVRSAIWGECVPQKCVSLVRHPDAPYRLAMPPSGPQRIVSLEKQSEAPYMSQSDCEHLDTAAPVVRECLESDIEPDMSAPIQEQNNTGCKHRVYFHPPIKEESYKTQRNYPQNTFKCRALSRNNNAFDETARFLLNAANNLQQYANETSSCEEDFNSSNKCLKSRHYSFVELNDLPADFDDHVQQDNQENPKSMSISSDCFKGRICDIPDIVLFRNDAEMCKLYGQPTTEMPTDTPLSSKDQISRRSNETVEKEHLQFDVDDKSIASTSDKLYVARDDRTCVPRDDTTTYRSVKENVKNKTTSTEKRSRLNRHRGGDTNIDKNVSEDSLIILGHNEGASAFRMYRPAP